MPIQDLKVILPTNIKAETDVFTNSLVIDKSFIELLVYDLDDILVNEDIIPLNEILNVSLFLYTHEDSTKNKIILNPGIHLRKLGYSNGMYKIKYNFFTKIVGDYEQDDQTLSIKKISPSRTEISIFNSDTLNSEIKKFMNLSNEKLIYYTYFSSDRNFLIVNKTTFNGDNLLKLYDELSIDINTLEKFTIVEKFMESYEDTITLHTELVDDLSNLNVLNGPKVNYKLANITHRTTNLENFETLSSTIDFKIDEINRSYLSSSLIEGIDLNIDYRDYKNFIHFSSANQRLKNFKDKISKIEFYDSKISLLTITTASNETSEISSSISYYLNQKNNIINTFDQYEVFMYFESGSYESSSLGIFPDYTWPKYTSIKPYYLYPITSSEAISWYDSMLVSSSEYDNLNPNILTNTIPLEITLDDQNSDYVTYIQMIGHILDINYNYINRMTSIHERQNSIDDGIPKELILPVINNYGFDLRSGNVIKGLVDNVPSMSIGSGSI